MPGEIDPRQQAAHGMADEMQRPFDAVSEALDGRVNIFGERLQRFPPARIVEIEHREAAGFQGRLHFKERSSRSANAVKQDDPV